jgi:hypothetical protein
MAVAGVNAYLNGVADGTITAGGSAPTHAIHIGAFNNNGVVNFFFSGNIQALAIYSTTLDAAQVAQVSAAMSNL